MPNKTARLHKDEVPGYGSYARCYELSYPVFDGGLAFKYVTIVVHPGREKTSAEVSVIYANAHGMPAELTVRRRAGSFIPIHDPHESDQDYMNGCFVHALESIGYIIEGYGDQPLKNGLDYNPDDIPEEIQ